MDTKKINWHKISESVDEIRWNVNSLCEIEIGGKQICLARQNEKLFAFVAKCPHAGGFLVNGYVDAMGNIVCPLHRYKFSLLNGRNISGEGYFLKNYQVEIRAEGVFIGLEENKSFFK